MESKQQLTIVLGVVRNKDGKVLLAKRIGKELVGAYGKWELVGGKVEYGEEPEAAVVREVKEESGLDVKVVRLLPKVFTNIWQRPAGGEFQVFLIPYECEVLGGQLSLEKVRDEIGEFRFVDKENIWEYEVLPNNHEIIDLLN